MGKCLGHVGVAAVDTRDSFGRHRFLPLPPVYYLVPKALPKSNWFWQYTYHPMKEVCIRIYYFNQGSESHVDAEFTVEAEAAQRMRTNATVVEIFRRSYHISYVSFENLGFDVSAPHLYNHRVLIARAKIQILQSKSIFTLITK